MTTDELYMYRCTALARLGAGFVAPNPMVGAVLVHNNKIIGEGYHQLYGQPHAEVNCINDATVRFRKEAGRAADEQLDRVLSQSTLYVSLEPCAHYGKTPPCANLIIEKKIPAVVIGCRDPFYQVDGKGIDKLVAAGVQVKTGVLQQECTDLNKRFFTQHVLHRPYVVLKWAQSFNHKIAAHGGERTHISHAASNRLVHKWRSEEASILVGTATALADNPALTTRLWTGKNPVRLVIDKNLRLPAGAKIFDGEAKTIVFNYLKQEANGIIYHKINKDRSAVQEIMEALYSYNIQSMLVEGGAVLLQHFINENCWDEARVITNTRLEIESGPDAPVMTVAKLCDQQTYGWDEIRFYKPA